ncbi:MAG: hypothetical protein P4L51_07205 [Puia sp.]|nr:hypothetical protein [Puia sp.]
MQRITNDTIDYVNARIQDMEETQVGNIWDGFAREQPALVGYVLGESSELEEPDAREDIAYILTIILLSFREVHNDIPAVTEEEFEVAFNTEFDKMEAVFQEGFDETEAMNMLEAFSQPDLLQFAAAVIYGESGDETESNFTEEEAGLFIVIFRTIIELLNAKGNGR